MLHSFESLLTNDQMPSSNIFGRRVEENIKYQTDIGQTFSETDTTSFDLRCFIRAGKCFPRSGCGFPAWRRRVSTLCASSLFRCTTSSKYRISSRYKLSSYQQASSTMQLRTSVICLTGLGDVPSHLFAPTFATRRKQTLNKT